MQSVLGELYVRAIGGGGGIRMSSFLVEVSVPGYMALSFFLLSDDLLKKIQKLLVFQKFLLLKILYLCL